MDGTLDSLLAMLALDALPRTGWIQAGIAAPESIAAHSLGTALVVAALAPAARPALDLDRAIALAVLHDVPEARLGDLPRSASRLLPPGAKAAAEQRAAEELLGPLPADVMARFAEVHAGATPEARFVGVCDKLQLGVRLLGYQRAGWRGLERFRAGLEQLDCLGFEPCAQLRERILARLDATA